MADSVKSNHGVAAECAYTDLVDPRLIDLVRLLARDAAERSWQDHCDATDLEPTDSEEDSP